MYILIKMKKTVFGVFSSVIKIIAMRTKTINPA